MQIVDDAEHRMAVFRHHFVKHPGTNSYIKQWSDDITLDKSVEWTIIHDQAFKWEKDVVRFHSLNVFFCNK
jgi:uncharacterized protein YdeI (YjbR/CyaY-like superfamily)